MKAEFRISRDEDKTLLSVKGDLVAQVGEQFKEQLQQLLQGISFIQLSLQDVKAMDVSSLQLIRSFREEVKAGRDLQIVPPDNSELIALLTQTGLFPVIQPN